MLRREVPLLVLALGAGTLATYKPLAVADTAAPSLGQSTTGQSAPSPATPGGAIPIDSSRPHPSDTGAAEWDDLSPDEQLRAAARLQWAEEQTGEAVHDAYAAATATTSAQRILLEAQRASGLEGIETLGVEP